MKLPSLKDVEEAHEEFGYFMVKWAKHFYNEGIKDATPNLKKSNMEVDNGI